MKVPSSALARSMRKTDTLTTRALSARSQFRTVVPMRTWTAWITLGWLGLLGCSKPASTPNDPPTAAMVPSAEQTEVARRRGRAIATETFGLLRTNLQTAIQSGGISNALPFCSIAASPLTASMAEKHGVTLRRITHKARQPSAKASETERTLLSHFESLITAASITNPPPPVVTNLAPGTLTFFAPIVIGVELCLKCHGEPGTDIAQTDLDLIRKLYPQDEATGFKLGQLRGAWRIDFPMTSLAPGSASGTPQHP